MATNKKVVYCGSLKRILAFIFDFSFTLLFAIIINSVLINPLFSDLLNTDYYTNQYQERLVESNLYVKINDSVVSIDSTYNEQSQTLQEYVDYLDNQLNMFYSNGEFECSNISMYEQLKLNETEIFYFDEISNSIKTLNNVSLEKQREFYEDAVAYSINTVLVYDDIVSFASTNIIMNSIYSFVISFLIIMSIFFLLVPLLNKKRATFGKFIFKIGVVNTKDYKFISKKDMLIRFAVLFIEIVLSFFTFGGIVLISFAFTIFSKNDSALHDFAAKTTLVDLRYYNQSLIDQEDGELAWN